VVRSAVRDAPGSIRQFPGDKDAALAADLHAGKALVKARNGAADTLMKRKGLRIAHLGFAVVTQDRFAILVSDGLSGMVVRGVELDAVDGTVAGVMDLEQLARLGHCAGADLDFLITQGNREYRLLDSLVYGNAGGRLDVPRNERIHRNCRLGWRCGGLGRCNSESGFGRTRWAWRDCELGCSRSGSWGSGFWRGGFGWGRRRGLRCGCGWRGHRGGGGSLGACGSHARRQGQNQNRLFHCVVKLRSSSSGECIRPSRLCASGLLPPGAVSTPARENKALMHLYVYCG